MQQEDDINIGGNRVRLSPLAFKTGAPHKCAMPGKDHFDLFAIGRHHDPVAHGDFGPYVAHPHGLNAHRRRAVPNRAPTTVKARHPSRQIGPIEGMRLVFGDFGAR